MADTLAIEIHVLVSEDGEFVVGKDRDELADLYASEHGTVPTVTKAFSILLSVPRPGVTIVRATVDKSEGPVRITVE
jgi:hypothetical protein